MQRFKCAFFAFEFLSDENEPNMEKEIPVILQFYFLLIIDKVPGVVKEDIPIGQILYYHLHCVPSIYIKTNLNPISIIMSLMKSKAKKKTMTSFYSMRLLVSFVAEPS